MAESAGLTAPVIYGGADHKDYILETDGCGCAFFDCDNDGWMDIFILSGTRLTGASTGATNRLYKNDRDRTSRDVTEAAGLVVARDVPAWGAGCSFLDCDRDGHLDLFVSHYIEFDLKTVPSRGRM